jgi:methylated-DNA-protein-cysteine methyltransferase-like protein
MRTTLPSDFDTDVYDIVRQIPVGRVVTYGRIARLIGCPQHARRVGKAMGNAPAGLPCHRVVNSSGETAPGWMAQRKLLEDEGVRFTRGGRVDLKSHAWAII